MRADFSFPLQRVIPAVLPQPRFYMNEGYLTCGKALEASAVNPFDRSYNELQKEFDASIIQMLSAVSNFTVHVSQTPLITALGTYEVTPNAWIAEQLTNGTSEISSTTMVLTPETSHTVCYSFGVGYFRPQLFYKARSVREENNIYYIPFSSEVWICLFGLLLIITVALTFILGRETKLPHDTPYDIIARIADEQHEDGAEWNEVNETPSKESLLQRERWEMGEILLIAVGALGQQGSARDPSTSAARTLLLVMFLLAALAYTAYSASVISFVSLLPTIEKEQRVISKSLPSDRRILIHNTNFFMHSFQSVFKEVDYTEIHCGLDDAISGKILFIGDQDTSLTYIHRKGYGAEQRCTLARVFLGIEYQRVFAVRKNSTIKETIDRNLLRLRQFGLLSREKRRIFDVRYPCSFQERSSVSGFVSFNIEDIKPAWVLLASGLFASAFLLLVEQFAFSGSKAIRKLFITRWTANDKRLQKLISDFSKANGNPKSDKLNDLAARQGRDAINLQPEERMWHGNQLPFIM